MRFGPVALAAAATLWAGCGGAGGGTSTSTKTDPPRRGADGASSAPTADVVRRCDRHHTGVGYGGVSPVAWRNSLRVGPIALGSLGVVRLSQFPHPLPGQQRFGAFESIAKIRAGATVTVAVPAAERRYVGLIYDQSKFRDDGAYHISDLDWVARFEACGDPHFNHGISQYDGGLVVAQHRCFTLEFYIKGRPGRIQRRVPATGDCRAPSSPF